MDSMACGWHDNSPADGPENRSQIVTSGPFSLSKMGPGIRLTSSDRFTFGRKCRKCHNLLRVHEHDPPNTDDSGRMP